MKKLLILLFSLTFAITLCACGVATPTASTSDPIPDLTGKWKQVGESTGMYHKAIIANDTIEINWIMESDKTEVLYWAGTFNAPTTSNFPYVWDSQNNKEKTNMALLASPDDLKTFTYDGKQISYTASAMGVTKTIILEKQ